MNPDKELEEFEKLSCDCGDWYEGICQRCHKALDFVPKLIQEVKRLKEENLQALTELGRHADIPRVQYLEDRLAEYKAAIEVMAEVLNRMIGKSHSWVIDRETAEIKDPIYALYRTLAKEALSSDAVKKVLG